MNNDMRMKIRIIALRNAEKHGYLLQAKATLNEWLDDALKASNCAAAAACAVGINLIEERLNSTKEWKQNRR